MAAKDMCPASITERGISHLTETQSPTECRRGPASNDTGKPAQQADPAEAIRIERDIAELRRKHFCRIAGSWCQVSGDGCLDRHIERLEAWLAELKGTQND